MAKQNIEKFHIKHHKSNTGPTFHSSKPVFSAIDNDLAVDNLINDFDMTMADLQDLENSAP